MDENDFDKHFFITAFRFKAHMTELFRNYCLMSKTMFNVLKLFDRFSFATNVHAA